MLEFAVVQNELFRVHVVREVPLRDEFRNVLGVEPNDVLAGLEPIFEACLVVQTWKRKQNRIARLDDRIPGLIRFPTFH